MAEIKTQKTAASVSKFISSVKDPVRRKDAEIALKLFKEATGMTPRMWGTSIVGFGQYHYKSERSRQEGDWPLTGFSPRAANVTFHIMPGFKDFGPLLKKLGKHSVSGGSCIYVRKMSDIHVPTLKAIVKKSVVIMKKRYPATAS
ncbi:MAG TPA: DUF1801 domain-containing protein [Candidatus Paceibacterota bacterium]|nr:DUF1801 domain-containing protein [Candidatus Paceibacterota bacterium]